MSNCEKYNDLISLYLDSMLENDDDLMDLLEHLDECDECNALYIDLKSFMAPLKEDTIEYPEDLNEQIWDYISKNKEPDIVQYKAKSKAPYLVGLAACVIAGVVVSSDSFQNRTLNLQSHEPAVTMSIDESENEHVMASDAIQTPAESRSAFNIEYNQYAFVLEFFGSDSINEQFGEIIYSNADVLYIKAENTLHNILKNVEQLNESGFTQLDKSSSFNVSDDSEYGIYIIYFNNK